MTIVRVSSTHKLWDGWGEYCQQIPVEEQDIKRITKALEQERGKHELLGEWRASSICSNDILSSCFYTIGLVTSYAGKMVRCLFALRPSLPSIYDTAKRLGRIYGVQPVSCTKSLTPHHPNPIQPI